MEKYKFIIDVLSSLASLLAIVTVLWAWISSKRNALSIKRVIIHQNENTSNYILEVENTKPYSVEIKNTRCFTKKNYKVEQVNNYFPSFHTAYSYTDSPFLSDEKHVIEANGFTDIRFLKCSNLTKVKELMFLMDTSHGSHSLKCKNITVVKMGSHVFEMEAMEEYESDSRFKAVKKYCSLVIRRILNIIKS